MAARLGRLVVTCWQAVILTASIAGILAAIATIALANLAWHHRKD